MGRVSSSFFALPLKGRQGQERGNKRLKKEWRAEYVNRTIKVHARQQSENSDYNRKKMTVERGS